MMHTPHQSRPRAGTRRLAALDAHLQPEPSAGVLRWLSGRLGLGGARPAVAPPAVRGEVKMCFVAPPQEEIDAQGGTYRDDTAHFGACPCGCGGATYV